MLQKGHPLTGRPRGDGEEPQLPVGYHPGRQAAEAVLGDDTNVRLRG